MEEIVIEVIKNELENALLNKDALKLNNIFEKYPTIDIAQVVNMENYDITKLVYIFKVCESSYSADLFKELNNDIQKQLIDSFADKDIVELLSHTFADDLTDYLQEMPANVVSRILQIAPKELRENINRLLNYKENTAGSIMTTEYLLFNQDISLKEAIKTIQEKGKDAVTIYTIFIRDDQRNLVGTIDLDDLIFNKEDCKLKDIMNLDFQTADVNQDQEEVANIFKRYDLNAIAVLNNDKKICGVITSDDIMDVISKEAAEDITNISNVSSMSKSYLETPIMKLVLKCLPWIVALMILQIFSSMILSSFQSEINKFAILSVFSPMILDAAGNSGGQTTGLMIRSLSLDEIHKGDWKKVFFKEFRVGLILALIVGVFGFLWCLFELSVGIVSCHIEDYPAITVNDDLTLHLLVSLLVSLSLFVSILLAKIFGVFLCFIASKLKRDPAVMAQPLVTTLTDVVSLLTYFAIWVFLFEHFLGI